MRHIHRSSLSIVLLALTIVLIPLFGGLANATETHTKAELPDLTVPGNNITLTPFEPIDRDKVTISVTIQNDGETSAIATSVRFFVDGEEIDEVTIERIAPYDSENASVTWTAEKGDHNITVQIAGIGIVAWKALYVSEQPREHPRFEEIMLWVILAASLSGLVYAFLLSRQVLRKDEGNEKMKKVSNAIRIGANTYLKRQLKTIVLLILILAILLFFSGDLAGQPLKISVGRGLAFLMGAGFSAAVGYFGMNMAVRANVRVASAARRSFGESLTIAYRTGTIVGMLTDGLGLLGGILIFMIYRDKAYEVLLGYGFGGCLLALFMRVGGGIYTKAADVGADLVGKVEKGIPEDDPRNAAVIADQVGDNVGDCAGMAADIFESYEVTIVSAMILGWAAFAHKGVIYPLMVRAIGVFSSIVGTYAVRSKREDEVAIRAIFRGFATSSVISVVGFALLAFYYADDWRFFGATFAGIMLAICINYLTDYFTSDRKAPVKEIAKSSQTGSATTILTGFATGLESTVWALFVICGAILTSVFIFWGDVTEIAYGVALVGIGMLTLTGNTLAMDSYGPIVDNANGIGEIASLEPEARQKLADLDAVGNTTKAITKGIAIGSAVVAATCLFASYVTDNKITSGIDVSASVIFVGLLIGGAIPFLFSSMVIRAVGRAAHLIVQEVRHQFATIKGLWEGKVEPDYAKPVDICTMAAQKELIGLGLLAVLTPIIVGFLLREIALGAFLAGTILSAQLLAVFMANAGGAWDNAKKSIEDGLYGGKGSDAHKASVIGDTVGDPLKDTSGPALNPMVKVINLVALIIAPIVIAHRLTWPVGLALIGLIIVLGIVIWNSKKESF